MHIYCVCKYILFEKDIKIYLRSPCGIGGRESVCGVGQLTPLADRVAFEISVFPKAVKAQKNSPSKVGRLSITRLN